MRSKKENPIHVRIEFFSAVENKKGILETERNLINLIKKMNGYSLLRKREFILKNRLRKELAEIGTLIRQIEEDMPQRKEVGIEESRELISSEPHALKEIKDIGPEELREMQIEELEKQERNKARKEHYKDIERDLETIKRKLERLG